MCAWRCATGARGSRPPNSSVCSRLSTPRSRAAWGWGCRSAARSSKRTTDGCGRARTRAAARPFNSRCLSIQPVALRAQCVSLIAPYALLESEGVKDQGAREKGPQDQSKQLGDLTLAHVHPPGILNLAPQLASNAARRHVAKHLAA